MKNYSDIPLLPEIQKALQRLGFESPTLIQEQAIPVAMENHDVIGCAQTGTGKTAAFCIPLMSKLLSDPKKNGLILVPTRELAFQVIDFWKDLAAQCPSLRAVLLIGGADMRRQIRSLQSNKPRVIVATPGRLMDHLQRKTVSLANTSMLVLDEADRMLDMGFMPQLNKIIDYLPATRQTMLFSATLPPNILKLASRYLKNPRQVMATPAFQPVEKIKHSVVACKISDKGSVLLDELNKREGSILIFTRTKDRTDKVAYMLMDHGYSVTLIHGDRSQGQRNNAIRGFREGKFKILVATDIAARGLDIPHIGHVINYDLPQAPEDYIHRIGRTARAGAEGEALCLLTAEDNSPWKRIAKMCKLETQMPRFDQQDLNAAKQKNKEMGMKRRNSQSRKKGFSNFRKPQKRGRFNPGGGTSRRSPQSPA